jgi:hypothetical protein
MSEWVGVDGWGNNNLIRAGVTESQMDPTDNICANGEFYAWAWTQILPGGTSPIYAIPVTAGRTITMTISEETRGYWTITVSNGRGSSSSVYDQRYTGPASSAEWVSGAFSEPAGQCGPGVGPSDVQGEVICPAAPFTPSVKWSGLTLPQNANATNVDEITMVQNGTTEATPSDVDSLSHLLLHGFTTSFGSP